MTRRAYPDLDAYDGPVVALDLGSTRLKAARYTPRSGLADLLTVDAPVLARDRLRVEGDPDAYRRAALRLLDRLSATVPDATPLAVTSQRSSFVLWDEAGKARSPLVHWSDRSAAGWVEGRDGAAARASARAGLPLSPHYAGPKLAARIATGGPTAFAGLRFGNLDAWLAAAFDGDEAFATDPTMASRTLLFDLRTGDWSDEALDDFAVPRGMRLPRILPSRGIRDARYGPFVWGATLGDQSASTLSRPERHVRVNLGTGGFVLVPAPPDAPIDGTPWLTTPLGPLDQRGRPALAREGTIHAVAAGVDRQGPSPTVFPDRDTAPDAFVYPDDDGWGAPRWRPRARARTSVDPTTLEPATRRRVWVEGVLFRVREILEGIEAADGRCDAPCILSGGLSNDPALGGALASTLGRAVSIDRQPEATLLGVASFATRPRADLAVEPPEPPGRIAPWLARKYSRWRDWIDGVETADES